MGIKIECNGKEILDIKNITFEFLYQNMLGTIREKNLALSSDLKKLIEDLDLGGYGIGLDISEHIKKKKDGEIFGIIVKTSIENLLNEFNDLPQTTKSELNKFYESIMDYTNTLS